MVYQIAYGNNEIMFKNDQLRNFQLIVAEILSFP